jgi:hypothetical protein
LVFLLVQTAGAVGISPKTIFSGGFMALSDTGIKKAKATDKLLKLSDGGGLQLHIAPTGGKL